MNLNLFVPFSEIVLLLLDETKLRSELLDSHPFSSTCQAYRQVQTIMM